MRFSHRLATYACAIALAGLLVSPALAAAPPVGTQAPAFYRASLGSFEITALSDGTVDLPVDKLLLGAKAGEVQKTLGQSFMRIPTTTSVNAYLVNTGSKLVMFDAGAGTLFGPTLGKLVDNLKAAGYQPDQVDEIYITHLHPDHVGGLAANGQRVFANAVVRAEQRDVDFWLSEEQKAKAPADAKGFFDGAMASLKPYADAGKLKPFTGDTELVPGVRAVVTRGHTAGHSTYVVEDQGQRMVVWGDLIHVAAVQFAHPQVAIAFDSDSKNAVVQRRKAFDAAVKSGAIAAGAHLAFPGLGHLRARGRGYEWIPLNYQSDPKARP